MTASRGSRRGAGLSPADQRRPGPGRQPLRHAQLHQAARALGARVDAHGRSGCAGVGPPRTDAAGEPVDRGGRRAASSRTLAAPEEGPAFVFGAPDGTRIEVGGARSARRPRSPKRSSRSRCQPMCRLRHSSLRRATAMAFCRVSCRRRAAGEIRSGVGVVQRTWPDAARQWQPRCDAAGRPVHRRCAHCAARSISACRRRTRACWRKYRPASACRSARSTRLIDRVGIARP